MSSAEALIARSIAFLAAAQMVQRHFASGMFPCPQPLAGPGSLGAGVATAETLLDDGVHADAHQITAVYDWDSVAIEYEPVLVGSVAHGFTSDWAEPPPGRQFPTLEEAVGAAAVAFAALLQPASSAGRTGAVHVRVPCSTAQYASPLPGYRSVLGAVGLPRLYQERPRAWGRPVESRPVSGVPSRPLSSSRPRARARRAHRRES